MDWNHWISGVVFPHKVVYSNSNVSPQKTTWPFFCRHIHISNHSFPIHLSFSKFSSIQPIMVSTGCNLAWPWMMINTCQAQTPQQRRANDRFAKTEAAKRGKAPTTIKPKKNTKSPLSASWVGMYLTPLLNWTMLNISPVLLAFVVCGGLLLELLRIVPDLWSTVVSWFTRTG